jgi:serine/threonine-protein kinase
MVSRPGACDSNRLRAFLDTPYGEDGGPCELADHLERCEKCRAELEAMAGGRWWDEVRPYVRPAANNEGVRTEASDSPPHEEPDLNFLSPPDQPGHLGRFGPYQVLGVLGKGGMGVVLKALDPALRRVVAIKVLSPILATSGASRQRFTREAQAAAAVVHNHVVAIFHIDTDKASGLPYLVMPCIVGRSLQERIDRDGPLDVPAVLRIGMQAASGLAAAHAQGIVHRDVKPANILLENGVERVVLTDFGLARAVDDASLTQSGVIAGTPQYMSPEQARGEPSDHRSDLFSLGSVLYAMCTGHPPFRASSALAVLRRVSDEQPRPIRELNPAVPEALARVIDTLHAKNPADRYQTAAEVAAVLEQLLADLQKPGRPTAPPPRTRAGWLPRRRRPYPLLAAALIVVAFVALFAVVSAVTRDHNSDRSFGPAFAAWANRDDREETDDEVREAREEERAARDEVREAQQNWREAVAQLREAGRAAGERVKAEAESAVCEAEKSVHVAEVNARAAEEKVKAVARTARAREMALRSRDFAHPVMPPVPEAPAVPPVPPIRIPLPAILVEPLGPLVRLDSLDGESFELCFGDGEERVDGSGKVETRAFDLTDFNAVDVRGPYTIELKQGKDYKVSVTADDNLFEFLRVEKDGKKLVLGFKAKHLRFRQNRDHAIKAAVTLPELEDLHLNGAAHATAEGFKSAKPVLLALTGASHLAGSLTGDGLTVDANGASMLKLAGSAKNVRLKLNGASQAKMADFQASGDRLIVDANGASSVALKGSVTAGVVKGIGASHLNLGDLRLAAADVTLAGASHATVRASEKLDYNVSGASHLSYYGDPAIGEGSSKNGVSHVSHKE